MKSELLEEESGGEKGKENRNSDISGDLGEAINDWLPAREQSLDGFGRYKLERFTAAAWVLYAAFAEGWKGDEHSFATAFHLFREDGGDWVIAISKSR
jgi:hypothetical protein